MDILKLGRFTIKKIKLVLLYFRRIIFAKNNFKVSFFTKLRMNIFGGYLADQYVIYDFKHNDKKPYLSEFDWYRSRYINEPFDFFLNNKIMCTEVLKQYTNVPEIYVIKNRGVLSRIGKSVLTYDEVFDAIREHKQVFIKPYGAGKGTDVYRFDYIDGQFYVDGEQTTIERLKKIMDSYDNWMICQGITQAPFSASLYDKTVNTIRLITFRDIETEKFRVFFAVQRIGTKETIPVDNGSRGGLVSKIDLETGELSEAKSLHSLEVHDVHPDSGAPIKGVIVPGWEDVKKEMLRLSELMPYVNFIAWDIVLTEDGINVIEANTSSGVNIIQLWGGQRYGELGDFYRHHKVKV